MHSLKQEWPIDCLINILAKKYNFSVFVFQPNLAIANLVESDTQNTRDMDEWSKKLRWDLNKYNKI